MTDPDGSVCPHCGLPWALHPRLDNGERYCRVLIPNGQVVRRKVLP